jgi:hypothetical protein
MAAAGGTAGGMAAAGGTAGGMAAAGGTAGGMAMPTATLRIVHGANAPAVDVCVGTTPVARNLAYGEVATAMVPVGVAVAVDVRAANAMPCTGGTVATGVPAGMFMNGQKSVAIARGTPGGMGNNAFSLARLDDGFTGMGTRLRVVHASGDAPTVGVDLGNDGMSEVDMLAFNEATAAAGLPVTVPAGTRVAIRTPGATGGTIVTVFTIPAALSMDPWYVIAVGTLSSTRKTERGFGLVAINATTNASLFIEQDPRVHLLHAGADVGGVDIFSGMTQLADNLTFGNLGTIQVPPGMYTVDAFPTSPGTMRPAGNPALSVANYAVAAGNQYLVVAAYFLNPPAGAAALAAISVPYAITSDSANMTAPRISVVHASGDAPAVDIGTVDNMGMNYMALAPFQNVARGAVAAPAGVTVGTTAFNVAIRPAGGMSNAARFAIPALVNGTRAYVVAAGALAARMNVDQSFRLLAVVAPGATGATWSVLSIAPTP